MLRKWEAGRWKAPVWGSRTSLKSVWSLGDIVVVLVVVVAVVFWGGEVVVIIVVVDERLLHYVVLRVDFFCWAI